VIAAAEQEWENQTMENESNVSKELHDIADRLSLIEGAVAALVEHAANKPMPRFDFSDIGGKLVGHECRACGRLIPAAKTAPEESVEKKR
jgi:hypothetical protein